MQQASRNDLITVRVNFAYVLIIEWLNPEDTRTGQALFDELKQMNVPAEIVRCKNCLDVWKAIALANQNIALRGIPAVHIESHGVRPSGLPDYEPQFKGEGEHSLRWSEVGRWLAPINDASGFHMLLVGATCWGQSAIATMTLDHAAPFAICMGFSNTLKATSVRAVMSVFYWQILEKNATFEEAREISQREFYEPGVRLESVSSLKIGYNILQMLVRHVSEPEEISAMIGRMRTRLAMDGLEPSATFVDNYPAVLREHLVRRSQKVWDTWFPRGLQHAHPQYCLNWEIVDSAPEADVTKTRARD
jgi:hypothetical protein